MRVVELSLCFDEVYPVVLRNFLKTRQNKLPPLSLKRLLTKLSTEPNVK